MARKGENIYKRKDGRWEGRYIKCHDSVGKAKYGYVYSDTYKGVKEKLRQKLNSHYDVTSNSEYRRLKELLYSWLRFKKISVKESTYAKYKYSIDTYILPKLGNVSVDKIDRRSIELFTNELLTAGSKRSDNGLSPKTVSSILVILKSALNYGAEQGINIKDSIKGIVIRKKDREMRVLTVAEQSILTAYLTKNTDLYKLGVLISLYTGIRIGELCALRWENVDFNKKSICIKETLQRIQSEDNDRKTRIIITEAKSSCSVREIPIPDCIMPIICRFVSEPKAYVLTGKTESYTEPRTMQYHFARYIREAGIKPANYHSLRHTFATRCVEAGFEIKSLSEILGHANVNITLNRYVHSSFELKAANMNKLTL